MRKIEKAWLAMHIMNATFLVVFAQSESWWVKFGLGFSIVFSALNFVFVRGKHD